MTEHLVPPLDHDAEELIAAERHAPGPPTAAHGRVWARLAPAIGAPTGAGPGPTAGSPPVAPAKATGSLWIKGAVAGGIAAVAVVAILVAGEDKPRVSPSASPRITAGLSPSRSAAEVAPASPIGEAAVARGRPGALMPAVTPPPPNSLGDEGPRADSTRTGRGVAPAIPAGPGAASEASRRPGAAVQRRPSAASRPAPTARASAGDLTAERVILESARAALASGRPDGALAAIAEHSRRFPRGQLVEERESLRIRALYARGDTAAALERSQDFRRRYPRSIFLPAIDALDRRAR